MRMSWRGAWLAWVVAVVVAGDSRAAVAVEGPPGGGFPAEGVEFLVVSPGLDVCLSSSRGKFTQVGVGRPCEWDAPGAEQRWRYHAGQLVNVASGGCLFAESLGPCEEAVSTRGSVSYELLAQRLVWDGPREGAGCFVLLPAAGGPEGTVPLGLAALDSRACGAEHVPSKWMLVPVR